MRHEFVIVALAGLALAVGGCASKDLVKDGDRQLLHLNSQGLAIASGLLDLALVGAPPELAERLRQAAAVLLVVNLNNAQLQKNLGMPEKPEKFGADTSKKAREDSEAQHATPWYVTAGMGLLTLATGAAAMATGGKFQVIASIASRLTGGFFKSASTKTAEATMAGAEQFMRAAQPQVRQELEDYLQRAQQKLGVDKLAGKILAGVKTFVLPALPSGPPEGATAPAELKIGTAETRT